MIQSEGISEGGTLYIISCASRTAERVDSLVTAAQAAGWDVVVIATPKATNFIDLPALEKLTNHPVKSEYRRPEEPDILPRADAIIVFPATFNTINKWALGISDTLALDLLNEYTGLKKPILAVPCISTGSGLDSHPVFHRSMMQLQEYGVQVFYDPGRYPPRNEVPPEIILEALHQLSKERKP